MQFRKPFLDSVNSYGNRARSDGTLANDFDMIGLSTQFDTHVLTQSLSLFADLARNIAADDDQDAASVGAAVGDCSQPGNWLIAYQYTWLE